MRTSYTFSRTATQRNIYCGYLPVMHCTYTRLTVLHEKPYMFCVLIPTENKNGKPKDLLKSFHVLFPSHISSVFVQRNTGEYSLWLFKANFWSLRTTENDGVRFILGNNPLPSASNTLDIRLKYTFLRRSFVLSDLS